MKLRYGLTRCGLAALLFAACLSGLPVESAAQLLFDQAFTESNDVRLAVTNYGIIGLDVRNSNPGGLWRRSADHPGAYMHGAGVWFAALVNNGDLLEKRVFVSYNDVSGNSWAAPGDVSDGPNVLDNSAAITKYRVINSRDYDAEGQHMDGQSPGWPLWDNGEGEVGSKTGNLGRYVSDINDRNTEMQGVGPAYVSDEDVVCRYKDTDVNLYEGGAANARPIGLQIEQAVYSWNEPACQDFVLVRYDITNVSGEDLYECFFGHVGDYDIGDPTVSSVPAGSNDNLGNFKELRVRRMVALWSEDMADVQDEEYGYCGVALMQSPSVDADNFIIADADPTDLESQIGLQTVRSFFIQNTPSTTEERYDFISSRVYDGDIHARDVRVLLGSGPFNLRAGETARFVVGIFFAPSVGESPDGTLADMVNLVATVDNGYEKWRGGVVSGVDHADAADFGLQLNPNPVGDQLNIVFNTETPGAETTIEILDLTGRTLLTQEVRATSQQDNVSLTLDDLAAGSYFCRLSSGGRQQTAGFVVVR